MDSFWEQFFFVINLYFLGNIVDKRRSIVSDHLDSTQRTMSLEIEAINNKVDKLTDKLFALDYTYRQESESLREQLAELLRTLKSTNTSKLKNYANPVA